MKLIIKCREGGTTKKHGRNEILLTNQMVLIVGCDFSSIVIVVNTQRWRFRLNSLKFSHTNNFSVSNRQFRVILTIVWPGLKLGRRA